MCDEHFGIYAVTQWEVLEQLVEKVINFKIIFGLSFSLKSIEFIQVFGLVIASTHEEVIWQAHLPREHRTNNLTGETATINEVTVEKIWVFLRRNTIDGENVEQIIVLSMDITANCDFLLILPLNINT